MRDLTEASKEEKGGPGRPVVPEFGALVAAFLEHLRSRGLSPATERTRAGGLRPLGVHLRAHGIDDVRQMTRAEVDGYVAALRARRELSPHTKEVWIGALKAFFRFMVDTNRMLLSPAEHVRERNLQGLVGPTITPRQAERLLRAPNTSLPVGVRDRTLLELLYGTGLRRQEAAELTVFDVDLAGGLVRVAHAKGGGERVVPLGATANKWLATYLESVRPKLAGHTRGRDDEHALFLGFDGRRLSPAGLAKVVKEAGKKARIRVSCHTLRRTMATEMLRNGASIREVAELLGHALLGTTQRYTKVVPVDLQAMHDRHHPRGGRSEGARES
jgi:integrase/recombinase XerD